MGRPSWIWLALALTLALGAQQTSQKKEEKPKEEPAPLFDGQLGARSSKKTKESATLGFNGIDPSGKVDKAMMSTSPKASDEEKVKKMAEARASEPELSAFIQEGGLKKK